MRTIENIGAQGDVLFRRVERLPDGAKEMKWRKGEEIVVAHSETGHHHVARGERIAMHGVDDPMICYLSVSEPYAEIVHLRNFDTHETIRLSPGIFEVRRQREHTPEGWRRVED